MVRSFETARRLTIFCFGKLKQIDSGWFNDSRQENLGNRIRFTKNGSPKIGETPRGYLGPPKMQAPSWQMNGFRFSDWEFPDLKGCFMSSWWWPACILVPRGGSSKLWPSSINSKELWGRVWRTKKWSSWESKNPQLSPPPMPPPLTPQEKTPALFFLGDSTNPWPSFKGCFPGLAALNLNAHLGRSSSRLGVGGWGWENSRVFPRSVGIIELVNIYIYMYTPIPSMGLVYLPTFGLNLCGKCK